MQKLHCFEIPGIDRSAFFENCVWTAERLFYIFLSFKSWFLRALVNISMTINFQIHSYGVYGFKACLDEDMLPLMVHVEDSIMLVRSLKFSKVLMLTSHDSCQAIWVWTMSLPVTVVNGSDRNPDFEATDIVGWVLWAIGLFIEAVADQQKLNYEKIPASAVKGDSMMSTSGVGLDIPTTLER